METNNVKPHMKTLTLTADLSKIKTNDEERLGLPSASAAPRLANCPGSWLMEKNQPQLTKYADSADSGTRIHEWLSGKRGVELSPPEKRTAERLEKAHVRYVDEWLKTMEPGTEADVSSVEERWFLHAGITPVTSGKWDVIISAGAHHIVLDFKTGWQELPPLPHNLQLRVYALLVYQKYPEAETITVGIVREGDDESEKLWMFTYTRPDLEAAWFWWQNVLNAVFSENPPLVSGEHCVFCKAQYTCQARITALTAFRASNQLDRPISETWATTHPDRKAALFKAWKAAEKVGESIEEAVKADLKAGLEIPGLSIGKTTSGGFDVDDPQDAYKRFCEAGGTHAEFMACVKVSFSQLRDTMQPKKGWKVKDATTEMKGVLAGGVTEKFKSGGIKIV